MVLLVLLKQQNKIALIAGIIPCSFLLIFDFHLPLKEILTNIYFFIQYSTPFPYYRNLSMDLLMTYLPSFILSIGVFISLILLYIYRNKAKAAFTTGVILLSLKIISYIWIFLNN